MYPLPAAISSAPLGFMVQVLVVVSTVASLTPGAVLVSNAYMVFFEALRHHEVPVDMTIFKKGDHGLFLLPRDRWRGLRLTLCRQRIRLYSTRSHLR